MPFSPNDNVGAVIIRGVEVSSIVKENRWQAVLAGDMASCAVVKLPAAASAVIFPGCLFCLLSGDDCPSYRVGKRECVNTWWLWWKALRLS